MRIRRRLPIIAGVLVLAIAVAVVVELRRNAPPEPARLLPGADAFLYVNLQWIRRFGAIKQLPPVSRASEYEKFIQDTGIEFERDLDRAAFAIHYPASWGGATVGAKTEEPRFSEVFEGNIHADKLVPYLRRSAGSIDPYRSTDIYNIKFDDRTLRVAILGVDTVAASNSDDPSIIRGIIDRSRKLASPFAGPALLRHYYKEVPLVSLSWAIVRVTGSDTRFPLSNGVWALLFQKPATLVVSARYLRALHVRADAITGTEDDASRMATQASTVLNIFKTAELSPESSNDPDTRQFFDSLKVTHHEHHAVLTAILSPGFIRELVTEPPAELAPAPAPAPTPAPAPKKKRGRRPPK